MFTCPAPVDCTIPDNYTVSFNADSDIDGIGVIAAFYVAAWITVILLFATYFTSSPRDFDTFGFSKLDILVLESFQSRIYSPNGSKTTLALQKAILVLSDQQLITGLSIGIVGLTRICNITQYHFSTIMNLSLVASIAHTMTFSFVAQYVNRNVLFRSWRAIAMVVFATLNLSIWIVTGSNDWLEVYGLPALCGYRNLGQDFGPPAIISLALLYWFQLRGWAFAVTVLIPSFRQAHWVVTLLSTSYWLEWLCKLLQTLYAISASHLRQCHKIIQEIRAMPPSSNSAYTSNVVQHWSILRRKLSQATWNFLCGISLLLYVLLCGVAQVWKSFAFNLFWTCYTLSGSCIIIATSRDSVQDNGMVGNESEWTFGQQLPLLMLLLPTFAILEIFFDNADEEDLDNSDNTSGANEITSTRNISLGSPTTASVSSNFSNTILPNDLVPEKYYIRRRVDTEQKIGMDTSDGGSEPSHNSNESPTRTQSGSERDTNAETDLGDQGQELKPSFTLWQFEQTNGEELQDILLKSWLFRIYMLCLFALLSYIMVNYGI